MEVEFVSTFTTGEFCTLVVLYMFFFNNLLVIEHSKISASVNISLLKWKISVRLNPERIILDV